MVKYGKSRRWPYIHMSHVSFTGKETERLRAATARLADSVVRDPATERLKTWPGGGGGWGVRGSTLRLARKLSPRML